MELLKTHNERVARELTRSKKKFHRIKIARVLSLSTLALVSMRGEVSVLTSQFNFFKNFNLTNLFICLFPVCFLCYCVYKLMRESKII